VQGFGVVVAVVSGAVLAALVFRSGAERFRMPAPVVFLLAAAAASDLIAPLGTALSPTDVSWIASGALVVILFDGGVSLGWSRVRPRAVVTLGFGATLVTAGVMALARTHCADSAGAPRRCWVSRSHRPIRQWCFR
jgi:cell volume regulation protein A